MYSIGGSRELTSTFGVPDEESAATDSTVEATDAEDAASDDDEGDRYFREVCFDVLLS
jgi:hypothetical protein